MNLTLKKTVDLKEIPDLVSVMEDATREAEHITIGETLFMKKYGVRSEAAFKKYCMEHGKVMKHSQIGWNSWENTVKGFRYIYEELEKRGSHVDRFGICLDWSMGVPEQYRSKLPKGNGLIFDNPEDWKKIGKIVPIQIHMGDHMIGSMNSFENTKLALIAGVTSIGNVSHYYTYEYSGVDLEQERTGDTMRAIALMGLFRGQGTIIHSNLDDGFGSQFQDLVNLTGWAMLERYIVEDLLGGGMCHCFGNLFSNPIARIAFSQAMWEINKTKTPGTMIYGNTTDFDMDFEKNYGTLSSFLLGDIVGQLHCPTGHAVTAIPVTQAAGIPNPDEIIQANMVSDMLLEKAPYYEPYMNWEKIAEEKELLVCGGQVFFERIMNGLSDIGVDLNEPGQIMVAVKYAGAGQLEALFGAGVPQKGEINGRIPIRPTDIAKKILKL